MRPSYPVIAVTGPLIPRDVIRARGFEPVMVTPRTSARHPLTAGACAVAHGWAAALETEAPRVAAVVLTTRCDQLRRTAEGLSARMCRPVFVMNIPATQGTETASRLYRSETQRLDRFLSRLPGASRQMPAAPADDPPLVSPDTFAAQGLPRVGLLGCCLTESDDAVLQMVRQVGLQIVVHATERPFDVRPTIAQRPNAPFFEWLRQLGHACRLEGWVLLRQPWCDLYHAEVPRLKSQTALPWLDLETGAQPAIEALRTRAEAFLELLRAARGGFK